jgi:hypothetical protein
VTTRINPKHIICATDIKKGSHTVRVTMVDGDVWWLINPNLDSYSVFEVVEPLEVTK